VKAAGPNQKLQGDQPSTRKGNSSPTENNTPGKRSSSKNVAGQKPKPASLE